MKFFSQLDKAFESRVRLGVMSVLLVNDWVAYTELKDLLDLTDGNLASHLSALEKIEYVEVRKEFVGKKPKTSYRVTAIGKSAFQNHLKALEEMIKRA
ncbi:MAG: winged helix-turn-helix domain-containing protein [Flavobacteriales bacterium]